MVWSEPHFKEESTGCVRQRLGGWKPHSNSLGLSFPTEVPGHIWWSLGVLRVWLGVAASHTQQVAGLIHTVQRLSLLSFLLPSLG